MDAAVHWLHLMAAIIWVGGTLFTSIVVQPALRAAFAEDRRFAVYADIGRRLSVVQWTAWSLLLATGLWKLLGIRTTPEIFFGPFGKILAAKFALVAVMISIVFCGVLLRYNPW